jgi:TIMELESS-interacting protein
MDPPMDSNDVDLMQEDLLDEIYEKAADVSICPLNFCKRYTSHKLQYSPLYSCLDTGSNKEASEPLAPKEASSHDAAAGKTQKQQDGASSSKRAKIELTEEQRARMEANRLKALERAAARARASQSHAT